MPVLNEGPHLRDAVEAILAQGYPGQLEVVLALGPSRDDTTLIAQDLAILHPCVVCVDNPSGRTPSALNAAIAAASHEILARVDGHALLPEGYLATAVRALRTTGADNVGGRMAAVGVTPFEQAVACAMTSPLGVGSVRYHTGGQEGPANSVYLGVFRREALARVGGFDEAFVRAQDWELNYRLRASGGVVWFVPQLDVTYRPRPSYRALARQYADYGSWRRVVMRRYPETVSPRYLAAPVAVVGVVGGAAVGAVGLVTGLTRGWWWPTLGWVGPLGYGALITLGAAVEGRHLPLSARLRLPAVLATMHLAWGTGFLARSTRRRARP